MLSKAIQHLEDALARFRWAAEHEPFYWTGAKHKTAHPDEEEWAENQRHMQAAKEEIEAALKVLRAQIPGDGAPSPARS